MIKKMIVLTFLLLSISNLTASPNQVFAQLKKVSSVDSKSEPVVFRLMFKSAQKLSQTWDQNLAEEIARVYSIIIRYNQNSYVVELINPAVKKWDKRFEKVLFKKLDKEQKKLYKDTMQRHKKEIKEGNG
jgi:hypothetical protein